MRKIVICEDLEDFKNVDPDSIVIIPRSALISLLPPETIKRLKKVLDTLKAQSRKAIKHWFDFSISDIELQQIDKELRKINENVKVFSQKIISLDLIESLLKSNVIPVLIV